MYMLRGVTSTAQQTFEQVTRIRGLMEEVRVHCAARCPGICSKDLIEVIFATRTPRFSSWWTRRVG